MKNKMVHIECPDIFVTMRQAKITWENMKVKNDLISTSNNNSESLWGHFVSHILSAVNEFKQHYKIK